MKLFKLPEHKVFEYKPLYYDPVKDRLAQRRKALGLDTDVKDVPGTGGLLRSGAMRERHDAFMQQMEDGSRRRMVRTITIVVLMVVIVYLTYNGTLDIIVAHILK